ncbi:MAG: endonuclease/exonuclease/phosphatase family protein [Haliea sp.]|jgi:endonuclease/exonuclease/phosphatase family metal-dependent hydrolase|nr:endonuclease/exonuclease/phosphatase family protein [Haliea sp.]MDP4788600.1 endonuclease/exonuclease/phosphatase family protein [Haliea sp.]MDP5064115.1 endonuclease/exonuclease/phosphatase family protein [Haliea sp.]
MFNTRQTANFTEQTQANSEAPQLRILTYNIHKGFCSGNRRFVLEGIRERIVESGADVVFLQEVHGNLRFSPRSQRRFTYPEEPHFEYLADQVWPHYAYARNAIYRKGDHGNALLSRYPISSSENIDVSIFPRSSRSILHSVLELPHLGTRLHTLCVHLGLLERERRQQLKTLVQRIDAHVPHHEPLILAGDFNDWRQRGAQYLQATLGLQEVFMALHGQHARSFPVWAPMFPVDRIYYRGLQAISCQRLKGGHWRDLSDHAALLGRFNLTTQ